MEKPRILEVRQGILKKNDQLAGDLRGRFHNANICVIDLVSSPGAGKTAFLEETLRRLNEQGFKVAALVGDLATENDAKRLERSGVPVRQIETHGICHLEAEMIERNLEGWDLEELDFLFIENVGNLVCPSSYDLGEDARAVLHAVTEGEDKPLKYPTIFNSSDIAIITKIDLAEVCEFDREACYENIHAVRPGIPILETSGKKGIGFDEWFAYLKDLKKGVGSRAKAV
ncbi:MAG: hydrogenase nickel incorporation protein HypB [Pyrinomonadaceae bacterium]|nr:hydrogenase nickel incorporation protein HypB [Pyrinomonadaceae bacterium]